MKNKISTVLIDHYTVFGNGAVEVTFRRKPWRRSVAGCNYRVYSYVTTSSAMRVARTVTDMIRSGSARGGRKALNYGTQTYIILVYEND